MIETTNLELCIKLEPILKGKIESEFFGLRVRVKNEDRSGPSTHEYHYVMRVQHRSEINFDTATELVPAYTACELMKVLPKETGEYLDEENPKRWLTLQHVGMWEVGYDSPRYEGIMVTFEHVNPAEALGLMVIFLHGEGLLK